MESVNNRNNGVYLRAFETMDLDFLVRLRKLKGIFSLTAGNSYFGSSEYTKKLLDENMFSDGKKIYLMICRCEDDAQIGYISIVDIDHVNKKAQWGGIIIDPEYSGKGYGTFAGKEMLNFLFFELNMNKVYGYWLDSNTASLKIAEKLGFKEEGTYKEHVFKNNKYNDIKIMSILKKHFVLIKNGK